MSESLKRVRRIRLRPPRRRTLKSKARNFVARHLARGCQGLLNLFGLRQALAPHGLQAWRETIVIPGLGPSLDPLRIVQVSDLHCGPFITENFLNELFDRAWAENPDAIVLTGDYIDQEPEAIRQIEPTLRGRPAPPLGLFAVFGNHDYLLDQNKLIADTIERCGIRTLRNESVPLERNGSRLWLTGIEDFWGAPVDFRAAMSGVNGRDPKALLCHNPDLAGHARDLGYSLMLSGHCHGGQVVLPYVGPLRVHSRNGRRFIGGSVKIGATHLHVSKGVGMADLPLRLGCPPEFSVLTLVAKP
jgi:predicted MPP superfamily phosphohydrolase